jgi:hypothetical protein
MTIIDSLAARLPAVDARPISQIEQEIFDELDFHIAMRTEENMSLGMSAEAARSAALAQFGDFAAVQHKCRRALLGDRIMWQRIQMGLSVVLLGAVALLAVQLYNGQRANRAAIDDITSALKQLAPQAASGAAVVAENNDAKAEAAQELDPNQSYPITVSATKARWFDTLSVQFAKLKLEGKEILAVPIATEVGVTGAVLIGRGKYNYEPEPGKPFAGDFHAVMLRFNPKDADAVINLSAGKAVADRGAAELAKAILGMSFRHCYHAGEEALIPGEKALAADLFSRQLGEVLFSGDDTTAIVHNFSTRKTLYEKK